MKHERWTREDAEREYREYRLSQWDRMVAAAEPAPMPPLFRALGPLERVRRYLTPRRWLCVALVAAALAGGGFLASCAQPHAPRMTHAPLPPRLVALSIPALQAKCIALDGGARYAMYHGCVERDYGQGVCRVYTEPDPPAWIVAAELEHCAGGSHALR